MGRTLMVLVAVLALLAGCGDAPAGEGAAPTEAAADDATSGINRLDISATEFAFDHPDEVSAGAVELRLDNAGGMDHVAILSRIDEGATFEQAVEAMQGPPEGALDTPLLGVAGVSPGASGTAIATLEPGEYLFLCPLPTPDGAPHFTEGMVSPLTVTEAEEAGELPAARATVTAVEFAFEGVPELEAGEHILALENTGEQEHELNLIELGDGKTIDDVIASYSGPPGQGERPMRNLGGPLMSADAPGTVLGRFQLEAGKEYAFICAVPDFSEQPPTPHIVKGMHSSSFRVE